MCGVTLGGVAVHIFSTAWWAGGRAAVAVLECVVRYTDLREHICSMGDVLYRDKSNLV